MERKRKNEVNKRSANQSAKQCTAACRVFKCTLRSLSELRGMPDIKTNRKHEVWNWMTVIPCTHFRLVSHLFLKFTFIITCCFASTYKYEVTFLHQYDSMIISFWVRTEYSASMAQKRSLDWTRTVVVSINLCKNLLLLLGYSQPSRHGIEPATGIRGWFTSLKRFTFAVCKPLTLSKVIIIASKSDALCRVTFHQNTLCHILSCYISSHYEMVLMI